MFRKFLFKNYVESVSKLIFQLLRGDELVEETFYSICIPFCPNGLFNTKSEAVILWLTEEALYFFLFKVIYPVRWKGISGRKVCES